MRDAKLHKAQEANEKQMPNTSIEKTRISRQNIIVGDQK